MIVKGFFVTLGGAAAIIAAFLAAPSISFDGLTHATSAVLMVIGIGALFSGLGIIWRNRQNL
jgi:hypothetical protein